MRYINKVLGIVWKDMVAELRTKELFSSMFVFSLLLIVVFKFSFDLRVGNVILIAPGVLWGTFVFAGTLELNRSLSLEIEDAHLDGLLLAPVPRSAIYLGKMLGNLFFICATEAIMLPIFSALFNLNLFRPMLLLTVFLGTLGFASVGTLLSAMAANTRAREVMLPVLLFPIVLPVVISAVKLTAGVLDQVPMSDLVHWLQLLAGFDIIFLVVSFATFDYVIES